MVSAAMVSGKVSVTGNETLPAEAAIIASAATTSANVQLSTGQTSGCCGCEAQSTRRTDECDGDLAKRTSILKSLVETQCRLIAAEREAFGMDKDRTSDAADLSGRRCLC